MSFLYFSNNLFLKLASFSDAIISNSEAGLHAFKIKSKKAKVIYNGVRFERFQQAFNWKEIRNSRVSRHLLLWLWWLPFQDLKTMICFLM